MTNQTQTQPQLQTTYTSEKTKYTPGTAAIHKELHTVNKKITENISRITTLKTNIEEFVKNSGDNQKKNEISSNLENLKQKIQSFTSSISLLKEKRELLITKLKQIDLEISSKKNNESHKSIEIKKSSVFDEINLNSRNIQNIKKELSKLEIIFLKTEHSKILDSQYQNLKKQLNSQLSQNKETESLFSRQKRLRKKLEICKNQLTQEHAARKELFDQKDQIVEQSKSLAKSLKKAPALQNWENEIHALQKETDEQKRLKFELKNRILEKQREYELKKDLIDRREALRERMGEERRKIETFVAEKENLGGKIHKLNPKKLAILQKSLRNIGENQRGGLTLSVQIINCISELGYPIPLNYNQLENLIKQLQNDEKSFSSKIDNLKSEIEEEVIKFDEKINNKKREIEEMRKEFESIKF